MPDIRYRELAVWGAGFVNKPIAALSHFICVSFSVFNTNALSHMRNNTLRILGLVDGRKDAVPVRVCSRSRQRRKRFK